MFYLSVHPHGSLTQNICHLSAYQLSFYSWATRMFSSAFCKCGKKWFRYIKQRKWFPKCLCLHKRAVSKRCSWTEGRAFKITVNQKFLSLSFKEMLDFFFLSQSGESVHKLILFFFFLFCCVIFFPIHLMFVLFLAEQNLPKASCLLTSLYLLMLNEMSRFLFCMQSTSLCRKYKIRGMTPREKHILVWVIIKYSSRSKRQFQRGRCGIGCQTALIWDQTYRFNRLMEVPHWKLLHRRILCRHTLTLQILVVLCLC